MSKGREKTKVFTRQKPYWINNMANLGRSPWENFKSRIKKFRSGPNVTEQMWPGLHTAEYVRTIFWNGFDEEKQEGGQRGIRPERETGKKNQNPEISEVEKSRE